MNTIQIMVGKIVRKAGEMTVNQDMSSKSSCLVSSEGPVYLEGRLVLSLSFQGSFAEERQVTGMGDILERYRLWDDITEAWYEGGLEVLRFEQADAVVRLSPKPITLWVGAVDTRARVVLNPDLDDVGRAANREHDLCWKRV